MENLNLTWFSNNETELLNVFQKEGIKFQPRLGFDPLSGIVVVFALTSLVNILVKLYKDTKYQGVFIDAREKPVKIIEMPGWSRYKVLVITKKGADFIEFRESLNNKEISNVLEKMTELLKDR